MDCIKFFISEKSLSINTFRTVELEELVGGAGSAHRGDDDLEDFLLDMGAEDRGFTRGKAEISNSAAWIIVMFWLRTVPGPNPSLEKPQSLDADHGSRPR